MTTKKAASAAPKTRYGHKLYPLAVAQKFHTFYQEMSPKKEIVNIGLSLTIGTDVDFELLRESLRKAIERQESMRLRFTKAKDGNYYQYVMPKDESEIPYFNFWGWREEDCVNKLTEWTHEPFNFEDSTMFRITMITTPDGFNGVHMVVHHMIMDAQSIIMFLRDAVEIYCSEIYEDMPFPKPMSSFIDQLQKDLEYEAGSKARERDAAFFEAIINESEPMYAGFEGRARLEGQRKHFNNPNLRAAINLSDSVDATLDTFSLEADASERLLSFCSEHHISMATFLLMGLRTYFQKINDNQEDISINTAIARRATLKEKRCGGTRIHSFPFRTIMSRDKKFMDGLFEIRDKQNQYFMHANYNPTEYFAKRRAKYPDIPNGATYEPMALTYQPMGLDRSQMDKLGDIQYKSRWYPNGASVTGVYLTVMHRTTDNGLDFNFEHQTKLIDRDSLEKAYYYLCRIMFKAVENPDATIGEIIDAV